MSTLTAISTASSRHPHDWGRAVATALENLVAQAQHADTDLETAELFGADLTLMIGQHADGATITVVWEHEPES